MAMQCNMNLSELKLTFFEARRHQADLLIAFNTLHTQLKIDPQSIQATLQKPSLHGDGGNLVIQKVPNCAMGDFILFYISRKRNALSHYTKITKVFKAFNKKNTSVIH